MLNDISFEEFYYDILFLKKNDATSKLKQIPFASKTKQKTLLMKVGDICLLKVHVCS